MSIKKVKSATQGDIWVYNPSEILRIKAHINMVIGERSNGKTYAILELILDDYLKNGKQGMLIRRYAEDFKVGRGEQMFDGLIANNKLKNTIWDGVTYKASKFFLYRWDEELDKKVLDDKPFCYAWGLSEVEHNKSTSYSNVHYCLFDEFLSRNLIPLNDETSIFANTISTLSRFTDNVVYFLCANTVNKTSDYFKVFGINIRELKQGQIYIYTNDEGGKLAVEYVEHKKNSKKLSDKYMSLFDNKKTKMITQGSWEMNSYPRLPFELNPKDIVRTFYILWETEFIKAYYINRPNISFIYFQTTNEAIDDDKELIFSQYLDPRNNWRQNLLTCDYKQITNLIKNNKMYYDNDETGEDVRNYLLYCRKYDIIKS